MNENPRCVIYQVAVCVPMRRLFDYLAHPDQHLIARGTRVKVPFGSRELIGIIMKHSNHTLIPFDQLKYLEPCESEALFSEELCHFIEKTAKYYHHPIGEVAFTGTPLAFRQGKPCATENTTSIPYAPPSFHLNLNSDQQRALTAILAKKDQFHAFLLEGVTGSGKTEIYLQAAAQIMLERKQVLILVPEISLTPQTFERFQQRFNDAVICYHSRMTPKERLNAWLKTKMGQASIVIGTRSAIFLPFNALRLIIIDEEHDPSFKQQEGFRYSARDAALLRAKQIACPVILGSATPAFESLFNAKNGKYQLLSLPTRATATTLPEITQLDVRHKKHEGGLSQALLQAIEAELTKGGQVLLFINRRGFAPTFMCYACGWLAQCERCDARLTFHLKKNKLICHHCSYQKKSPTCCPSCDTADLHPVGQGTERLEEVLRQKFPSANLARIDSDVTRQKGCLEKLLLDAQNNKIQLLIGTQMLAKGHHFPHLTLVAIVDADGGLFSIDFRAIEKMAQLIIQVAGRAGRVHQAGKVIIQTQHPTHPLLRHILSQNYSQLADILLAERAHCHLPPFTHFALIRAYATNATLPLRLLKAVEHALIARKDPAVKISSPVPAPMLKRQGYFHYQLLIHAPQRGPLHQILSYATSFIEGSKLTYRVRWSLDVDPVEMF